MSLNFSVNRLTSVAFLSAIYGNAILILLNFCKNTLKCKFYAMNERFVLYEVTDNSNNSVLQEIVFNRQN